MDIIGAGHTLSGLGSGAVGIVNESVEVRKIGKRVTELLKQNGQDSLYLQIDKADSYKGENYIMRVRQANQTGCKMYIEIHLNKTTGADGTEIYTYNANELPEAVRILDNFKKLGFKNRGIKKGNHLYVINNTKMKSMLIECFFCDSQKDVGLYNKVGVEGIAVAIAEGVLGREIKSETLEVQNKPMPLKVIHDMVAMGIKDGQIYPVKEFHNGDLITVQRIVNRLGEIDVNGVKAYITMGYTGER